jgi:hypothetical protein
LTHLAFGEWPSVFGDANMHVAGGLLDAAPFLEGDLELRLVETAGVTPSTLADGPGNAEISISTFACKYAMTNPLPDIIARRLAVVFCGINPGMSAAAAGHHFVGRGNRFLRVIHLAGFTPEEILPENDRTVLQHRCGLTAVVQRPTARAEQLST